MLIWNRCIYVHSLILYKKVRRFIMLTHRVGWRATDIPLLSIHPLQTKNENAKCSSSVHNGHLPRNWKYLSCPSYLITASKSKTSWLFSLISFPPRRQVSLPGGATPSPAPPLQDPPVQHHNQRTILATPLVNTPLSGTLALGSPLNPRPFSSLCKTRLIRHPFTDDKLHPDGVALDQGDVVKGTPPYVQ